MNPEHAHHASSIQAKLGLSQRSWRQAQFFLAILPHRITYTARSVSQKKIAPGTQVRMFCCSFGKPEEL
jgi:hypothetical protein